jgi:phage/plasmid-like protein (TIGR03299 family)
VGDGYEPLQNRAAFAFCDGITDSGRAHWIGGGATRGGARVHALMRLDREIRIGGAEGEDVLPLLCFRNGHDGGLAVTVSVAPFRLACLNGMMLPLDGAERIWKARHTANLDARLADARRTLGIAWRYYDELEQIGGRLVRHPMSGAEFERFLARLVPLPEPRPDRTDGGRKRRASPGGDHNGIPDDARPRQHHRHPLGRAASGHDVRRPRAAHPRDRRPQPPGGALRARNRAGRPERPGARAPDRGR